jgi:hypothetical protein
MKTIKFLINDLFENESVIRSCDKFLFQIIINLLNFGELKQIILKETNILFTNNFNRYYKDEFLDFIITLNDLDWKNQPFKNIENILLNYIFIDIFINSDNFEKCFFFF